MNLTRQHYRVWYPESAQPMLVWGTHFLRVLDLSESGARIELLDESFCPSSLDDSIIFPDDAEIFTHANVVRTCPGMMALTFSPANPFSRILAEQRRLRKRYRHLDS